MMIKNNDKKAKEGERIVQEPYGEAFKFASRLKVNWNVLLKKLAAVPKIEVVQVKDALAIIKVDSRDIDNVPYQFLIIYFRKNEIEVIYSITPEISRKKRQLEVIRYLTNLMTLLENVYDYNLPSFMQLLDRFLADLDDYVSMNYDELYVKYDTVLTQYNECSKKLMKVKETNAKLSKDIIKLNKEKENYVIRLKELEKYSDSALMLKVQDWIKEHGGTIDLYEFTNMYKVDVRRVEQILNKMVREGYLELRR